MFNMLIIYYVYTHCTVRSTGVEATNEEFSRMLQDSFFAGMVGFPESDFSIRTSQYDSSVLDQNVIQSLNVLERYRKNRIGYNKY